MFTVSNNATSLIRELVSQPGIPEGAGLRITADDKGLSIGVSPAPETGDVVYGADSQARLFVADNAAAMLEDKTIDAAQDDQGRMRFVLSAA